MPFKQEHIIVAYTSGYSIWVGFNGILFLLLDMQTVRATKSFRDHGYRYMQAALIHVLYAFYGLQRFIKGGSTVWVGNVVKYIKLRNENTEKALGLPIFKRFLPFHIYRLN